MFVEVVDRWTVAEMVALYVTSATSVRRDGSLSNLHITTAQRGTAAVYAET